MKTLVVIRHAEAEDKGFFQDDFDRHLTASGALSAEMMGLSLKEKNIIPDLILASAAQRTRETAKLLAKSLSCPISNIRLSDKMYNGSSDDLLNTLRSSDIPDEVQTVFLIAHNPGITQFAMSCAPRVEMRYMPPCGVLGLNIKADHWADFSFANNTFLFFDIP